MAYCSVEEAWGAPLSPTPPMLQDQECKKYNEESHPVFTEKFNLNAKESESESTVAPPQSDQFEDSITDPPLRGSLLSGAIPDQTWKYKKENRPVVKEIESKEPNSPLVEFKYNGQIGEKLDKMIEILSKKNCTSWTDVVIFVILGILAIVVLDMFFRLGKWMIIRGVSQSQPQFRNTQPYMNPYYTQMQQMPAPAPMPAPGQYYR